MSRYLKQYEKEHMKMAMLKQEQTFKQQVQELHRLYRVQRLLMTDAAIDTMPSARCEPEEKRHARENEAGSSKPWGAAACAEREKAPLVLEEGDLELTLGIGSFGAAGKKAAKKEAASSSVDSRTSMSSSSTESGSPGCSRAPPSASARRPSQLGSPAVKPSPSVGQHLEQEGLKQPPWFHQCLNLAR